MKQWSSDEEWNARRLEALFNIYDKLDKHEKETETANTSITDTFMSMLYAKDKDGKYIKTKQLEEPNYMLWCPEDFNNMRKAVPYASDGKNEALLEALHTFQDYIANEPDSKNRQWAVTQFRNAFEDAVMDSQRNYSNSIIGSITSLMADFGKRTGFQAEAMDRIDHALADRMKKQEKKTEDEGGI